jgi:hypothetical protein
MGILLPAGFMKMGVTTGAGHNALEPGVQGFPAIGTRFACYRANPEGHQMLSFVKLDPVSQRLQRRFQITPLKTQLLRLNVKDFQPSSMNFQFRKEVPE